MSTGTAEAIAMDTAVGFARLIEILGSTTLFEDQEHRLTEVLKKLQIHADALGAHEAGAALSSALTTLEPLAGVD